MSKRLSERQTSFYIINRSSVFIHAICKFNGEHDGIFLFQVPVQRVTKYPLLLARLYKVTPPQHESRELLKEAQHNIELHLEHMNSVSVQNVLTVATQKPKNVKLTEISFSRKPRT